MQFNVYTFFLLFLMLFSSPSFASLWSENELHIQQGKLNQPFADVSGTTSDTTIVTFQHASGWEYGQHFFFVDYASTEDDDSLYAELWA